jgi:hypothetical protein
LTTLPPSVEMSTELPIAECRLDLEGLRRQRDRYRELGGQAAAITRGPESLTVRFGPALDRDLLDETIAVESECCPFFTFDLSPEQRVVTIGVSRPEQRPALDALAYALGDDAFAVR